MGIEHERIIVEFEKKGKKTLIAKKPFKRVKQGDKIEISYTERLTTRKILTRISKEQPETITVGGNDLFPELENELIGLKEGDEKKIRLKPEQAYGAYRQDMVFNMRVSELQGEKLKIGDEYKIRQRNGMLIDARLTEMENEQAVFNANHPLAGREIICDLKIHKIIPAQKAGK